MVLFSTILRGLILSLLMLIFIYMTGSYAAGGERYFSLNIGCENNLLGLGGGTVYDKNNAPIKPGALVQLIFAGKDGKINLPEEPGKVAGDDSILNETIIGADEVWKVFSKRAGSFFAGVSGKIMDLRKVKVYARAWDKDRGYYGNSDLVEVFTSASYVPLPEDFGIDDIKVNESI